MSYPVMPLGFLGSQGGDNDQYQISRSLRFNSADSANLSRTPASASNRKTWTWSGWVKRSGFGGSLYFFNTGTDGTNSQGYIYFSSETISYWDRRQAGDGIVLQTTAVYRDPSAWYHIVLSVDTTQATASDRVKLYVNGSQVTSFSTATYPNQNEDSYFNRVVEHRIGGITGGFFNGYLTEIHFIDGQALTPSDFGETDAITGRWKAKAYTGTYGTNGFYLKFSDNSNTTSATLGKDSAGSNDWTPNNFSVTAGAGNDSLVDSPTNYGSDAAGLGGEVRGNYCTLNPLDQVGATISNGNLDLVLAAGSTSIACGSIGVSSGKWYWEITPTAMTLTAAMVGIANLNASISSRSYVYAEGWYYYPTALKFNNNSSSAYGASFTTNDVIGVALNMDSGEVTFYKNGSSHGVAFNSGISGKVISAAMNNGTGTGTQSFTANFGQRPFIHAAPSGFKALCTTNLNKDTAITTSGSFAGNTNADGPFVYLNGTPTAMTINGNAVTFQTHADKLANGFKVRSSSASYNDSGSNTFSVSTTGRKFKYARAQEN